MTKRKILLVEDETALLDGLRLFLAGDDLEILACANGSEALAVARQNPVDLVVTDVKLPDLNGLTVAREIRKLNPGIPAIVMTAYNHKEDFNEFSREGTAAYFQKPINTDELKRTIYTLLHRRTKGGIDSHY